MKLSAAITNVIPRLAVLTAFGACLITEHGREPIVLALAAGDLLGHLGGHIIADMFKSFTERDLEAVDQVIGAALQRICDREAPAVTDAAAKWRALSKVRCNALKQLSPEAVVTLLSERETPPREEMVALAGCLAQNSGPPPITHLVDFDGRERLAAKLAELLPGEIIEVLSEDKSQQPWRKTVLEMVSAALRETKETGRQVAALHPKLDTIGDNVAVMMDRMTSDGDAARRRYLRYIAGKTRTLPMRGLDPKAADAQADRDSEMCLTDVYITLETMARTTPPGEHDKKRGSARLDSDEARPTSVLETFGRVRHMVLLGDPGSGKSTFVNHLIYCLACGQAPVEGEAVSWPADLPESWSNLLPVRVVLREMAGWLRGNKIDGDKLGLLESYLRHWMKENAQDDFAEPMLRQLREGKALLLLDGWDEVSNTGPALNSIREMLEALVEGYPDCPMLVTCRVRSYAEKHWQLDSRRWPQFTLLEFNSEKIDQFIVAWYRQLDQAGGERDWRAAAARLQQAVRRTDLRRMAGNPLLLTIMALDHADKGELPDARSEVYQDVVNLLLWKWRQTKLEEDTAHSLRDLLRDADCPEIEFELLLWEVAFDAHSGAEAMDASDGTADIPELTLRRRFAKLSEPEDWNRADALLQLMKLRAGLLIPSGSESYTFPHRTFQEFLAACHVCTSADVAVKALDLARKGSYWREVVLLTVNRLAYKGNRSQPFSLADMLCPTTIPKDDAEWRLVAMAGECLLEVGTKRAAASQKVIIDRVRHRLASLVAGGHLSVPERVRAGQTLAALGDPRDFGEMVDIPAGTFIMGGEDSNAPRHNVELPAFRIRKYSVTEQEYEQFVTAKGYCKPSHWQEDSPPKDRRNHPVVNISWDDACAYCEWLVESTGLEYALPTEAQWEKAARGSGGQVYPWGNEWDRSHCANSEGDNDLRQPVAVGSYPTGASPYGCLDMAGNVWEWCSDRYGRDYYKNGPASNPRGPETGHTRVVRGGAWYDYIPGLFRAACRSNYIPDDRYNNIGFRVALQGSA